jgi:type VI secretion system secreted protein Hcp
MSLLGDLAGFAKKAAPTIQRAIGKLKGAAAGSSADYYLKIEGVEGESESEGHKGEIEIAAFSISNEQVGSGSGGGGSGTGKVVFSDMVFTSRINKASPVLLLACSTGKHFPKATFTARKAGEGQQDYLKITLTDVLVSGYQLQDQGDGDPVPLDVFTLNFSQIDTEYKPQNADGGLGGAIKAGFDLKKAIKK